MSIFNISEWRYILKMGDILRKIEEIEYEMSKTQKNKATAGHLGYPILSK